VQVTSNGPWRTVAQPGVNGSGPLNADERTELVRLRGEVAQHHQRQMLRQLWRPGMPLPPGAEPFVNGF
jgi:hypothetical protein